MATDLNIRVTGADAGRTPTPPTAPTPSGAEMGRQPVPSAELPAWLRPGASPAPAPTWTSPPPGGPAPSWHQPASAGPAPTWAQAAAAPAPVPTWADAGRAPVPPLLLADSSQYRRDVYHAGEEQPRARRRRLSEDRITPQQESGTAYHSGDLSALAYQEPDDSLLSRARTGVASGLRGAARGVVDAVADARANSSRRIVGDSDEIAFLRASRSAIPRGEVRAVAQPPAPVPAPAPAPAPAPDLVAVTSPAAGRQPAGLTDARGQALDAVRSTRDQQIARDLVAAQQLQVQRLKREVDESERTWQQQRQAAQQTLVAEKKRAAALEKAIQQANSEYEERQAAIQKEYESRQKENVKLAPGQEAADANRAAVTQRDEALKAAEAENIASVQKIDAELLKAEAGAATAQKQLAAGEKNPAAEEQRQELEEATERLRQFAEALDEAGVARREILRGERGDGDVPETRQLGALEKLRFEELKLKGSLERADEGDVKGIRKKLQGVQAEIDELEGGTSRSAGQRQMGRDLKQAGSTLAGALGGTTGEVATALAGGIGIGTAAALGAVALRKAAELEQASTRLGGVAGVGVNDTGYGGSAWQMGVSMADFRQRAVDLATGSGSTTNLSNRTMSAITTAQAYGLDFGALANLNREGYRQRGGEDGDNVGRILSLLQRSGIIKATEADDIFDTSRLAASLDTIASLTGEQLNRLNQADPVRSAALVTAAEGIGPQFKGASGQRNLMSIDRAITNPGSDYTRAIVFDAIRRIEPNANVEQMQNLQQQGLLGERGGELYRAITQVLAELSGGRGLLYRQNLNAFAGTNVLAGRDLAAAGGNVFMGGNTETDAAFTPDAQRRRAQRNQTQLRAADARLTNMGAAGGVKAREGVSFLLGKTADASQALGGGRYVSDFVIDGESATSPSQRVSNNELGPSPVAMKGDSSRAGQRRSHEQAMESAANETARNLRGTLKVQVVNPPAAPLKPPTYNAVRGARGRYGGLE